MISIVSFLVNQEVSGFVISLQQNFTNSFEELTAAVKTVGIPCVVKPLMSSSGKGQSVIKTEADIQKAWDYAQAGKRGDYSEVIAEAFVKFNSEIRIADIKIIDINSNILLNKKISNLNGLECTLNLKNINYTGIIFLNIKTGNFEKTIKLLKI